MVSKQTAIFLTDIQLNGRPFSEAIGYISESGREFLIGAHGTHIGLDKERLLDLVSFVGKTIHVYEALELELTATHQEYPHVTVVRTLKLNGYSTVDDRVIVRFMIKEGSK